MSNRARLTVILAAFVGIGLAASILHAREQNFSLDPVPERLLYLRAGKTADRLMLTFDALAADIYWIRTIQSYGRDLKDRSRKDRFALVQPLLDLTTTLDPHFQIAYRFGAVFLALEPPNGPGRADQAIKLLEKGLAADPGRYWLAHDIAFVHLLNTGDYASAAEWFERAAAMPHAPAWFGTLAAVTKAGGGNRQAARQLLAEQLKSPDKYIRDASQRTLEQIDGLDFVDALQKRIDTFASARGRFPTGWPELIQAGVISRMPVDSRNFTLFYDAATGRAMLSPDSTLMPLPLGLKAK